MGVIPVKLSEVLSEFKNSLHSVDLRAAVSTSGSDWQSFLMGIRISARSVEEVQQKHLEQDKRFGKRRIKECSILMQAFSFSEWTAITRALSIGMIEIEREKVVFPRKVVRVTNGTSKEENRAPFEELTGRVERHHQYLRQWRNEDWPGICFSTGERSFVFHQPDISRAVRAQLGASSIDELVSTFLELKDFHSHSLDLFVHIEMPAKILKVMSTKKTIEVGVTTENNLNNCRLFMKREDPQGKLAERQELSLELEEKDERRSLWKATCDLRSLDKEDTIFCVLTHENGFELDEESGRISRLMPSHEANPLLECVRQFRDMDVVAQQIERPYETARENFQRGPQDIFQESIAQVLSLAGFQAINLGRNDKLIHPGTNVERATLDILAYHRNSNIMLLGACIITTPKNDDLDKLLHAKAILRRQFPSYSTVRLIPVLFSGQENEVESEGEIKILNPSKLAAIRRVIENGEEERFLRFLSGWPWRSAL